MHQSAVYLDFRSNVVEAELQLPVDRLEISFGHSIAPNPTAEEQNALSSYLLAHVHSALPDGRSFSIRVRPLEVKTIEGSLYVVAHLVFMPPGHTNPSAMRLDYDAITHQIVTHVVLVYIRSAVGAPIAPEDPVFVGMLRGERKSLIVDSTKTI